MKVACIYMTTIIGAGFASGQEIVRFFSTYYTGGFYGIILSGVLFSVIGTLVLDKVYQERIRNYDELVFPMVGWTIGWIMEIVVTLFMLCLFCVMIAGMGNVVSSNFNVSFNFAVMVSSILCMIVMLTDIKGIVTASAVITPVLIVGILFTGIYIIVFRDTSVFYNTVNFARVTDNWFFSALTYVSYNSIMSMVVMSSLLPYLKSRKVGVAGGIAGGLMLCLTALVVNTALFFFYPEVLSKELPMLDVVEKYSQWLLRAYTIVLWLAMFTSAVISGYYFLDRVSSKTKINIKIMAVTMCALVVPLANFGFSNLISTVYPIFGYIGMFMVFAVLLQSVRIKPLNRQVRSRSR